ncbi:MAG: ATP synthase F0 subunit B [Proteobacteria bacterium]|nr:ATP synthase F0 subunit B [Pseudomonadota bacterium]MBU1709868.1 ATP synthase F0 subunit B [Pseudomonadota bacterium]
MIDIDITMPIQIANILFLIVIMNIVLYKPIRTILEERDKKIAGLSNDVSTFNKNAELRIEEFEIKLNEARIKAKAELDAARGTAQATSAEKVAGIRKASDTAKAEQMAQIQTQFAGAQQELKGQVKGFANEMASKVLGRTV